MNGKELALAAIDQKEEQILALSDEIWGYAELSLKEYKSAAAYVKLLGELGFTVTEKLCGLDTAFCGSYGHGRPVIGILGEFDALSGLSQKGGLAYKEELVPGANGHGCGHNMLGAGALAAAVGVKAYLEQTGVSGTVIFYGCPGEEGGAGKALMAREGLWKELDCAITWHPGDCNEVATGTCNSCIQTLYKFHGVASHAAGDPEDGRSALDAVELMNVGVQYLREHVKPDARIHYAMVNGGGLSPNVVQAEASVLYMVRSCLVKDANALQKRVDRIAEGAAMMTETTLEKIFIDGCSGTVPNHGLEKLCYENMQAIPCPTFTEEEWKLADEIKKTYTAPPLPSLAASVDPAAADWIREKTQNGTRSLNDFVAPLWQGEFFSAGSTDVGDVSWLTPAVQVYTACFPSGSPGHSWQNVSFAKSSVGHKSLLYAGKVMAASAVDLFENPARLAEIRAEFEKAAAAGYDCPIPAGETIKAL